MDVRRGVVVDLLWMISLCAIRQGHNFIGIWMSFQPATLRKMTPLDPMASSLPSNVE